MIAIGVILCVLMGYYRAKRYEMKAESVLDLAILCVVMGFLGAKVFFVILSWKQFLADPLRVLGSSGFVVYGGIIFGVVSALIYCKIKDIRFFTYFDLLAPSVALAQALSLIHISLLDDIVKYLPSPEKKQCKAINIKTNEVYDADFNFAKAKSAYVFKTIVDPFIGKYSLVKVTSGVIKTDDVMYNEEHGMDDKIGKLYVLRGNKPEEVPELHAGDIGALAKLNKVATTDTLSTNCLLYTSRCV